MAEMIKKYRMVLGGYIINMTLLTVAWGGMLRKSFNSDTVLHMAKLKEDIIIQMEEGRFLCALTDFLLSIVGWSTTDHTGVTTLVSLLITAASVCIIQKVFAEYIRQETLYEKAGFYGITNLIFVNVLFAELLMFGECVLAFALAYFLAALGVYSFKKKKYIVTFMLILGAVCYYQVSAIFAIIMISGCVFFQNGKMLGKNAVIQECIGGICAFGAAAANMLSSRILVWVGVFPALRKVIGNLSFFERVSAIFTHFISMLRDSMTLLPLPWINLVIFLVVIGMIIAERIKQRKGELIYILLLIAAVHAFVYVIPYMSGNTEYSPRIVFPFYAAMSVMLLIAFQSGKEGFQKVICAMVGACLLLHIWVAQMIVSDHILSNQLDILYANAAHQKIIAYQEETGVTVDNLAVQRDKDCPPYYDEVDFAVGQINERVLGIMTNTLVNVMTDGNYNIVRMDQETYLELFGDKNWDYFDLEEQLVIVGDTAYWAIF